MFALIDGNNFYVSCERIFRPDLRNSPVVVLSNNDGCAIARSQEAKDLGIKMGQPYFEIKHLEQSKNLTAFSANFVLYGDISNRIVNICRRYCRDVEVYSIDESFLDFHGYDYTNLQTHCESLRTFVLNGLDIPTSIGIAPTKTLAKVANKIAKKYPQKTNGVYMLNTPKKIEKALKWFPIEDVWGIGRRYFKKFSAQGIITAWDFIHLPESYIRKEMGIFGIRMLKELKGEPQYQINTTIQPKKTIATTRTLAKAMRDYEPIRERVSTYAFKCSEKLRKQNSCCRYITVFISTDRFQNHYYGNSFTIALINPSNSAIELSKYANMALDKIFIPDLAYKKVGVIVSEFVPENARLVSLFDKDWHSEHRPLMNAIDSINKRLGQDKIKLGSMDIQTTWKMNQKNLSPRYTTDLNQILNVKTK